MYNKIILPKSFYETEDKPDTSFVRRMQDIDKFLTVYWNRFRGRWVIDRYTCETLHEHHPGCPRVNVTLVQGEDGGYHPLNDRILEWLRKADMWGRGLTPEQVNVDLEAKKQAYDGSRDDDLRHIVRGTVHDEYMHSNSSFPTVNLKS
jgi:hypothetical protein